MDELEVGDRAGRPFAEEVTNKSRGGHGRRRRGGRGGSGRRAEAVDEISAGAQRQSRQLSDVAGEMEDMSATVEEVAASADEVATTSQRARSRKKGRQPRSKRSRASRDRGPLGVRR